MGSSRLVVGIGVRAHGGRLGDWSSVPGIISTGRLTTTFFPFGTGTTGGAGGSGLCFRPGPPNGALGGPPMLMLGARLFLGMNGCPKGGMTIGKAPPSGVMGMAVGGGKAGKCAMLEWPLWCW